MLKCAYTFIAVTLLDILTTTTSAATVKNTDSKVQPLIIVEGSTISNISLGSNQIIIICMNGCFITFPNKDRFAIMAEDNIEISDGKALFK
ncbi:hypothetical protein [Bartonella sp. CB178]|uniref:hypothetical protein n=1 Tax=Bartonella sp. CB178 TaxID=3112255 RepID=UPI00300DCFE8